MARFRLSKGRYRKKDGGVSLPWKRLDDIAPGVLKKLSKKRSGRPQGLEKAWAKYIDPKYKDFTQIDRFDNKILYIKVHSHTLLSHLVAHEKSALLRALQEEFPGGMIQNLVFRR